MERRPLPPIPGRRPNPSSTQQGPGEQKTVDFFLPTGIIITLPINPGSNLREIKTLLFREARKYPLFSLLKDHGFYNFLGENWLVVVSLLVCGQVAPPFKGGFTCEVLMRSNLPYCGFWL